MSETILVGYSGDKTPVTGSKRLTCSECGTPVWISPSGHRLYVAGAKLICEHCLPAEVEPSVTPETLEELRNAIHGHRNRN